MPLIKGQPPFNVYTQKQQWQWQQKLNRVPSRKNTLGDNYEIINRIYNKNAHTLDDGIINRVNNKNAYISSIMNRIIIWVIILGVIGPTAYFVIKYVIIPRVSLFTDYNNYNKDNYNDND